MNQTENPLSKLLAEPVDKTVDARLTEVIGLVESNFPNFSKEQKEDLVFATVATDAPHTVSGKESESLSTIATCQALQASITRFINTQRQRLNLSPATIETPAPKSKDGYVRWEVVLRV